MQKDGNAPIKKTQSFVPKYEILCYSVIFNRPFKAVKGE